MLTIRDSQFKAMADAAPGRPLVTPCETTWVEIVLIDADGQPVAGEKYSIRLPDSSTRDGNLDGSGRARFDDIPQGQCQVSFPALDASEWEPV